ncbi:hypothetical protein V492_00313 [Pseudogymnoascus sp. VKM F-4246]|nr:hypothetical protein V492_00313 [Pseudogymnoascus sp. VKM F-4246]
MLPHQGRPSSPMSPSSPEPPMILNGSWRSGLRKARTASAQTNRKSTWQSITSTANAETSLMCQGLRTERPKTHLGVEAVIGGVKAIVDSGAQANFVSHLLGRLGEHLKAT